MIPVHCKTAEEWTGGIVDHGIKTGHCNVAWADRVGYEYGVQCLVCNTRYILNAETLKSETFAIQSPSKSRLLYDGLRTQEGRAALMNYLVSAIRVHKARMPKTAWERVLAADE